MGLFPICHIFRRSGTKQSNGTRYQFTPTSNSRYDLLPTASKNPVVPFYTTCSIPLTFLAGATAVLFAFTCWLATVGNHYSIYPCNQHHFQSSIDDYDLLGIILRFRESSIYPGQQRIFDPQDHDKDIKKEIIRPEITQEEVKEAKSNLWFKAEYTIEIPICEGGLAVNNGGACIHRDGSRNGKRDGNGDENKSNWVPAIESVRVSFCTGYGSEGTDDRRDDWEEERSWDHVFPPRKGSSEIHAAAEWIYGVEKRFLEKWRSVDVPGREHDTFFKTEMRTHTPGSKPQWQFLLTTAGVYINADAWNIYEEEVTVEVPVEKIQTQRSIFSRSPSIRQGTEVEKVLMWRWRGRYGGCPGEMDGREVVLEVQDLPESVEWVRDGEGEEGGKR